MLVPEIKTNVVNRIFPDPYGKVSAVLLIRKPVGITSHDVVAKVRRAFRTKRVGHAGALDPFADGLLVVLVGKFTKYTDALISLDKSYKAGVVLGVQTDTQDPEGQIIAQKSVVVNEVEMLGDTETITKYLQEQFQPGYEQLVPIYSSVKVNGEKLRNLARNASEIEFLADDEVAFVRQFQTGKVYRQVVKIPRKPIKINSIKVEKITPITDLNLDHVHIQGKFINMEIHIDCSKGTYIRQLAEDIGGLFKIPSFLYSLTRTQVGEFLLDGAISLEDLPSLALSAGITPAVEFQKA